MSWFSFDCKSIEISARNNTVEINVDTDIESLLCEIDIKDVIDYYGAASLCREMDIDPDEYDRLKKRYGL